MKHIFKYIFITLLLAQSLLPSNENKLKTLFKNLTEKLKNTFKDPKNNKKTAFGIGYGLFCAINNSIRLNKNKKETQEIKSYTGKLNLINYFDIVYLSELCYKKFFPKKVEKL